MNRGERRAREIENRLEGGELGPFGWTDDRAVCFMMERTAAAATGSPVAPDTLEFV